MFSRERTFTICEYTSTKEDVEPALREGFVVKMMYEKKIGCDKTELLDRLRSAWPILNTLWLKHCPLIDKHKKPSQLEILKELLKGHALEYPEFCQFVQLMIATSSNTSDLERAYSRLEMITTKCRNLLKIDNLETLCFSKSANTSEVSPPIRKRSGIFRRKHYDFYICKSFPEYTIV